MIGSNRAKPLTVVSAFNDPIHERKEFAAKVRAARAVLGWSQAQLGERVGVTQRSINRLEQATVDIRRSTAVAIEGVFQDEGVSFEAISSGGYRITVQRRPGARLRLKD